MIPINILINDKTVIDDLESCSIKMDGGFCNSLDLSLKSQKFWNECDPTTDFGELKLKVVIGTTTYEFLCEERSSSVSKDGLGFTVWGRAKQALLSNPYSKTISDTEDTTHPWQTGVTTAEDIVDYVVSSYCPYSVTVNWNITDFSIYEDSFSVSNQSPIEIISALANIVGAELKAHNDGSLSIETYSVAEETTVATYTDLDDIVELNENIEYSSGFNAVTIHGYDLSETKGSSYLKIENITESTICIGGSQTVRAYYYHSGDEKPVCFFENGSYQVTGSGVEEITEDVQLIWGHGNTSKPNINGKTEVTGDEAVPIDTVSITYSTNYEQFFLQPDSLIGEYSLLFYFEDKSAYSVHTVYVEFCDGTESDPESSTSDDWDLCGSIVVEKESPDTIYPGDTVTIYVYGWLSGDQTIMEKHNSAGTSVDKVGQWDKKSKTETVTFTKGAGSLPYPLEDFIGYSGVSYPQFQRGSKKLKIEAYVDNSKYYLKVGNISYTTRYTCYETIVPSSWDKSSFDVWFDFSGCSTINLSLNIEIGAEEATRDITISIKDYVAETNIDEAEIYIDGLYEGKTDEDGLLNVNDVSVGDHKIKIIASDYVTSDLDDLANDNFTVS